MKWHSQSYLGYRIPGSISFAVTLRAPPFTAAIAHAPLPLPTSNTCRPNISCGLSSIYLQPGTELTLPGSNYHLLKLQRQYTTNKLGNVEQWWYVHSSITLLLQTFSPYPSNTIKHVRNCVCGAGMETVKNREMQVCLHVEWSS